MRRFLLLSIAIHNKKQKLFLFLTLVISFSFHVFADTIPGVPICKSAKTSWCWAGAIESILKYYDPTMTKTQTEIASVITSQNKAATIEEITECIIENGKHIGLQCTMIPNTLSWSDMKKEADANQPFLFFIRWVSGAYHCEVFTGYIKDSTRLKFVDPAHGGQITYRSYTNCFNVSCGSNRGEWERTYVTSFPTPIKEKALSSVQKNNSFTIVYPTSHSGNRVTFTLNNYSIDSRVLQIYNTRGTSVFEAHFDGNTSHVSWGESHLLSSGMYYVTLTTSAAHGIQSSDKRAFHFVK